MGKWFAGCSDHVFPMFIAAELLALIVIIVATDSSVKPSSSMIGAAATLLVGYAGVRVANQWREQLLANKSTDKYDSILQSAIGLNIRIIDEILYKYNECNFQSLYYRYVQNGLPPTHGVVQQAQVHMTRATTLRESAVESKKQALVVFQAHVEHVRAFDGTCAGQCDQVAKELISSEQKRGECSITKLHKA